MCDLPHAWFTLKCQFSVCGSDFIAFGWRTACVTVGLGISTMASGRTQAAEREVSFEMQMVLGMNYFEGETTEMGKCVVESLKGAHTTAADTVAFLP